MYSFIYVGGGIGLNGCLDVDVLSQCHYICILKQKSSTPSIAFEMIEFWRGDVILP